ncbi:MAG: hypothetical protein KH846_02585 [Leptotrichia wadei]|jgi:hypothetical protein|uniref:hypothetical protein n=1 Tax=Leptotrichia wadei TaxID=157687 RepID=UPI0020457BED|nr:hypothetical protein [Leptotrichia wadei]MBS6019077.1 hypothetical protein [Leptotrichia wadei]DAX44799.1 MAG TPA: hypothetical protein [Caudoviricetes sp.]
MTDINSTENKIQIKKENVENKSEETKFVKSQIISSDKYKNRADLLNVLLEDDKEYTLSEIEKKLEDFLSREVK